MKSELYLMDENGEPMKKIGRFSEMKTCEVRQDPRINLKKMYESKFEGTIELTPESEAQLAELQKKLDAEIVENLKQQIDAVDAVIHSLKLCNSDMVCTRCPYRTEPDDIAHTCVTNLLNDAVVIAKAYRRVIESGLQMMEEAGMTGGAYYSRRMKNDEHEAVAILDRFCKTFCIDVEVTDDLEFRCQECPFLTESGQCLVKIFKNKYAPDYKDFGSMGDL